MPGGKKDFKSVFSLTWPQSFLQIGKLSKASGDLDDRIFLAIVSAAFLSLPLFKTGMCVDTVGLKILTGFNTCIVRSQRKKFIVCRT